MLPYDTSIQPPAPAVRLAITDLRRGRQLGSFHALVDSGADCTCIPRSVLAHPAGFDYEFGYVLGYDGRPAAAKFIRILDASVAFEPDAGRRLFERRYSNLRLLITEAGLLGRDLLNHFCELDGPALSCKSR